MRFLATLVLVVLWVSRAAAQSCPADTSGDLQVTVDELVRLINASLDGCPPRFVDNGDGTVTDNWNGLMWEKKSGGPDIFNVNSDFTWTDATDGDLSNADGTLFTRFVAALPLEAIGGYTDWRLPTITELQALADYRTMRPAIGPIFHTNCHPACDRTECACTYLDSWYWSATTDVESAMSVWSVSTKDGSISSGFKTGVWRARAVRGRPPAAHPWGAPAPRCPGDGNGDERVTIDEIVRAVTASLDGCPPRFVDNDDGTIRDNWTGLLWEKKGMAPGIHTVTATYAWTDLDDGDPNNADGTVFTDFLATLNRQGFAGHRDWRLPTVEELRGVLDYGRRNPSVDAAFDAECRVGCDTTACSCTYNGAYWSATAAAQDASNAWAVYFSHGSLGADRKTRAFRVRAVRGAPTPDGSNGM